MAADSELHRPRPLTPSPAQPRLVAFEPERPSVDELGEANASDDLLYWLHKGAQHLDHKQPDQARLALERAFQIAPENPKLRNLLGLAYFKLGLLEAAKALYDRLVDEFPEETPLVVNLGLVLLRQGRLGDAEQVLRRALAQSPDHTRAHCYLGLVLYRRGDLARARDHFLRGQAEDFARKVGEKLSRLDEGRTSSGDLLREVADTGMHDIESSAIPFRALDPSKDAQVLRDEAAWQTLVAHTQDSDGPSVDLDVQSLLPVWRLSTPPPALLEREPPAEGEPLSAIDPFAAPPAAEAPEQFPVPEAIDEIVLLDSDDLPPIPVEPDASADLPGAMEYQASAPPPELIDPRQAPVSAEPGFFGGPGRRARLALHGVAYARRSAVVAASGALKIAPESSRLQGRVIGGFGQASDPMCRLEGESQVFLAVPGLAVALRDVKDLHVVQSALWGFDGGFNWDNGRVLGIEVVTLSGTGSVLLSTAGAPMLLPVDFETPVQAARDLLLAWSEGVRPSPLDGSEDQLYRLHGKGYVLVAFPGEGAPGEGTP